MAIEVRQTIWGFDGAVVPGRINMLSVMVDNTDAEPFEGTLRLKRGGNTGANLDEPIYLAPFASRWVHFYPYIFEYDNSWTIYWGRRFNQSFDLPKPRTGKPAQVFLENPENISAKLANFKSLAGNLFPPRATATDSLAAVILDHAPRWEPTKRRAFRDWITQGGEVHLLLGENGKFPEFPPDLNELNTPLERLRLGSGMIFRYEKNRSEIKPTELLNSFDDKKSVKSIEEQQQEVIYRQQRKAQLQNSISEANRNIFEHLRAMTRPDHNWAVIHLMSIFYLLLIFPGCYLLGRKRGDYRVTFSVLLGIVLLFSFAFSIVGKRGYNETTTANSVALAKSLGDGRYDVSQWTNVFVTQGDDYRISHSGSGHIYSTCQQYERINGIISNSSGSFLVDIPPFSSRTFFHRSKLNGKSLEVTVDQWKADQKLQELKLSTGDYFQFSPRRAYILYRDHFYPLNTNENEFSLRSGEMESLRFVDDLSRTDDHWQWRFGSSGFEEMSTEQIYDDTFKPLLLSYINSSRFDLSIPQSLPPDRAMLFIYARMPENFFLTNQQLGKNAGYVLYIVDLFQPENS